MKYDLSFPLKFTHFDPSSLEVIYILKNQTKF